MTRHAALAEILALTEAAHDRCVRGDANPQTLVDLAARRAILLRACPIDAAASAPERAMVVRLRDLDTLLLAWGAACQHDLARTRSRLVGRNEPTDGGTRLLSDVA